MATHAPRVWKSRVKGGSSVTRKSGRLDLAAQLSSSIASPGSSHFNSVSHFEERRPHRTGGRFKLQRLESVLEVSSQHNETSVPLVAVGGGENKFDLHQPALWWNPLSAQLAFFKEEMWTIFQTVNAF